MAAGPGDTDRVRAHPLGGLLAFLVGPVLVVVGMLVLATFVVVQHTLLDQDYYERALERSDVYQRVYTEVLADPELAELQEQLLGELTPTGTNTADLRALTTNALRWSLPPARIRSGLETFLEQVLDYVRGDSPRLQGQIGVLDVIERIDDSAVTSVRTVLADATETVSATIPAFERQLEIFADELAEGRVPSVIPVVGGRTFDPEEVLDSILREFGDLIDEEVEDQIRAALLAEDQREALIAAAAEAIADHAGRVSEQLRDSTIAGRDIDIVASIAGQANLVPADVVSVLNVVRDAARWFRWPTALAGAGMVAAGLYMIWRRHRGLKVTSGVLAGTVAAGGVAIWAAWMSLGLFTDSPFQPATTTGPGSWNLPRGLRNVLADVESNLGDELARRIGQLAIAPLLAGGLVLGVVLVAVHRRALTSRRIAWATAVAVVLASVAWSGVGQSEATSPRMCNGSLDLCDRPYDEVVFAATHNSMSSPDVVQFWPEHDLNIREQLDDGVRALLIDTHYWTPVLSVDDLVTGELQIPEDLADRIFEALGPLREGRDGTFLCHARCALGAVPLVDALIDIGSFLDENPNDVVTLIIEDAISKEDTVEAFEAAGLEPYLYSHEEGARWPTLGQLIDSGKRLVVFVQRTGPPPDWYHSAFEHMVETPFRFETIEELTDPDGSSCRPSRGPEEAPLFLMNHWVAGGPPDRVNATRVNAYDVIVERALRCRDERGQLPNFIAVDFSNIGDLHDAVRSLNTRS